MSMPLPRNDNAPSQRGERPHAANDEKGSVAGPPPLPGARRDPAQPVVKNAVFIIGALSTIGPMAIDMYLPAFPAIAKALATEVGMVQLSMVSFFAALVIGQLIYGPVSDAIGRKRPIYAGLVLFVIASIGCALAESVEMLIALRFVQGIGACAGMVLARAIVRDIHTGREAVRLISLTLLVLSVSPMLAPLGGSLLTQFVSWRGIFLVIAASGAVCLWLMWRQLPETRPPERRTRGGVRAALGAYRVLMRDRRFLGTAFMCGCGQGIMVSYLTGSSFVFIEVFGVSPVGYSVIFAVNACALVGSAQMNATLVGRFGLPRLIRAATLAVCLSTVTLAALVLPGHASLVMFWGITMVLFAALGVLNPISAVLALESHGARAGAASSMLGGIQFSLATVAGAAVSLFFDGSARPLVIAFVICGIGAAVLAHVTLRRPASAQA
ncbi:Bcr/CflA family efflux transporter [Chelatococcus asaccharovorans]|nr:Bcr/CflA family efflux transporter [Chelatococcus asaccharovorans]CAH1687733.1 Bcr/CflA family efflux transporter [Chelatococcus asaccharovorans]